MKLLIGRVGTFNDKELLKAGAEKTVSSWKEVYDLIKNLKGKTYLISDWDGTILDSINPLYGHKTISAPEAFKEVLGISEKEKKEVLKEYIRTSGIPFRAQVGIILKTLKIKSNKLLVKKICKRYYKLVNENAYKAKLFKDASWLKKIKDKATIIISSSTTHNYLQKEVKEKLSFKPRLILGAKGDFKKGKRHLNYIIRRLRLPENTIVISDTIEDMKLWKATLKSL